MDVSQWPGQWSAAGEWLLRSRALRWLTPVVRVDLIQANGQLSSWDFVQGVARPAADPANGDPANGDGANAVRAVELLPDQVLRRQLVLPRLGRADLARAVALEVAAISPFPPERTASAFAAVPGEGDTVTVDVALTSTQEIEKRLQAISEAQPSATSTPEVWVLPASAQAAPHEIHPLIFEGYGGTERRRQTARGLALRGGLLLLALALLGALAVTPTAQARLRAIDAQQAFDRLNAQAAPQLAQREQMVKQTERLQEVAKIAEQQLAPLPVIDMLTHALPDGSWLSTLRMEGTKISMTGMADDTAALVRTLGGLDGVVGVRSPSPATRVRNSTKESFTLELTLDPEVFGVLRTGAAS